MARMERREMRNQNGYESGRDAAYIKPKLIPDDALLPRDDSGGFEFNPYTAEFGDGGRVTGDKAHLSARGGSEEPEEEDEESREGRSRGEKEAAERFEPGGMRGERKRRD